MSATITSSRSVPAPGEGLKGFMRRHPIASYYVIMFAGLWLAYLPLLLSEHAFGVLPISFPFPVVLFNLPASLLGPLLAGAIMSRVAGGKEGAHEYRRRLFNFRFGPQWYLLVLAGVPVLGVLAVTAVQGPATITLFVGQIGSFTVGYLVNVLLLAVLINLWEESGQMGFATPILQRSHGAILASLVIAVIWAFMHLPALFVPEMGVGVPGPLSIEGIALGMGILVAFAVPVRIIATWLFNNTGQSVVIVALFHAAMNGVQGDMQKIIPGYSTIYLIAAFAVVSFVLIAVTRGKLGYKREAEPARAGDDAVQPAALPVAQA
jgi:membrane protease YdiL (CAAX protease family)